MSTPIYALTEWAAAQELPWVPHNAAVRALEAVGRGSVLDRDLTAPPGTCDDGACYLIAATATGAWAGHDGKMAVAVGEDASNGWIIVVVATEGQFLYVEDEAVRIQYIGAAWITANLAPVWGDIGGSIADQTDLTAAIAASGGNTGGSQQLTGVVSGLGIINTANLDFAMSAGSFYLDSELVSAAAQTVSLDAADATYPRIDVLYVDDTGALGKITGTASATPSQPTVDPTTQLFLTFVLVPETATSLGGITNVDIYREGTEWTPTASGSGFTIDSTSTPYAGTKCIEGTAVAAGAYAKMVAGAPIGFDGDGNLTLRIRSKATWNAKRWLTVQWFLAGVAVGSQISLKSGSFGFISSDTSGYQLVVINKALFQVPAGATVDELRIADVGGSIGFFIDDVILQTTGDTTGGGGQMTGITQADADARYARRSNNLSDLTDVADARTNLDVYSKAQVDAMVVGLFDLKGNTDCSTNPNYPAALKGDAYLVSVAGKIGGASGPDVEVGDLVVAAADNAGGTQAAVGSNWFILNVNITGGGGGGGGLADGDYGDVTVSGTGTSIAVKSGVLDVANFTGSAIVTESEGLASSDNDTSLPTVAAVVDYVASAVTGLLDLKGDTDCSANPNYPAASKGDVYYVTVAGKIGGASGKSVDVGDAYVAKADNAGGTEASVGTSWFVLEHNRQDVSLTLASTVAQSGTPVATSVGFLGSPQMADQDDYTLALTDAGGHYYHVSATPHTLTIPANASVAFPVSTVIAIVNENGAGDITLAITSDTLRWTDQTGSRTIAANGTASLLKVDDTVWRLTGDGIT